MADEFDKLVENTLPAVDRLFGRSRPSPSQAAVRTGKALPQRDLLGRAFLVVPMETGRQAPRDGTWLGRKYHSCPCERVGERMPGAGSGRPRSDRDSVCCGKSQKRNADVRRHRRRAHCRERSGMAQRRHLAHLLPKRGKLARGHHAAMNYFDVPKFIGRLRERDAIAALALEFCILTATRSGEVLGARWSEIDFEGKVWTIPASRM